MALDSNYIVAPSLEMYFVNKDTGLPLTGGKVYFWADEARSVPRDVYTISGSPPNYNHVPLPNPVTLSSVGTFQDDDGNNILPYYIESFDDEGNPLLYFIEVKDSSGVLQFTREGWPNFASGDDVAFNDVNNFVPNGQFLLHNSIPASTANGFIPGKLSQDITVIAQGGWTFERGPASTSTDLVTFFKYGYIETPTGNPRYAVDLTCQVAASNTDKNLCLKFPDVNKFASPNSTLQFNLFFEAQGLGGSISDIEVEIKKYYGSGGSADSFKNVGSFDLTTDVSQHNFTLDFETNAGKSIGPNNDDYVQIRIKLPPNIAYSARFTNFAITIDSNKLNEFPTQTNADQLDPSTAGWFPTPAADGSDLYLPVVLTASGLGFDHSDIGNIVATANTSNFSGSVSNNGNFLLADGSQYRTNDYSPLGIPYSRLQAYLLAGGSSHVPQYGTGSNYATAYIESVETSKLIFTLNKVGAQTAPADSGTTFGFSTIIIGNAGYDIAANTNGSTLITAVCLTVGVVTNLVNTGTSGMTTLVVKNIAGTYPAFTVETLSAAALGNGAGTGKYFDFSSTTTDYRMWFQTATESAPAAGGRTLIKLILNLTMTATDVANVIANAMCGFQEYQIACVSEASIPSNSYFTFTANSQAYVVWYNKDGGGTAPSVPGAILISVPIATGNSAANVASATQLAINSFYFATPNLQGLYLRGYDPTGNWDIDYLSRYSLINNLTGGNAGTFELDQLGKHTHDASSGTFIGSSPNVGKYDGGSTGADIAIQPTGGSETRPVNMSVVWAIKY